MVAATIAVGWVAASTQLTGSGWISGGGTLVLLVLAVASSAGGSFGIYSAFRGRAAPAAVGFLVAAASPTVFAYPLNAAVVLIAAGEAYTAHMARRARHSGTLV